MRLHPKLTDHPFNFENYRNSKWAQLFFFDRC
jgi:hypothetical protein